MAKTQKIRSFLFYLSLLVFLLGLPFILISALSYKFDRKALKFVKSGLIALKTQPAGANVYLDNRLLKDKTPVTINEVLPGEYDLRLELEDYYPWSARITVKAGQVERLEKIILFRMESEVNKLSQAEVSDFWLDEDRNLIYYADYGKGAIYQMDTSAGKGTPLIEALPQATFPCSARFSDDGERIALFNRKWLTVIYPQPREKGETIYRYFALESNRGQIRDVFWHSDNYHLIVITDRGINIAEARQGSELLEVLELNSKDSAASYDQRQDALYFIGSGAKIYKLELGNRFYLLQEFRKNLPKEKDNGQK